MKEFKEINLKELKGNPFSMIGSQWMLVTAEREGKVNTMTASWGGLGVIWNKNVAYVFIRPQRYTKEFMDSADTFSLSFYDEKYKKELGYLGSVSGRDEDKILKTGFKETHCCGTPYFEEADLVLICKKLYTQEFKPECFVDIEFGKSFYTENDYHTMYIAEITKALESK